MREQIPLKYNKKKIKGQLIFVQNNKKANTLQTNKQTKTAGLGMVQAKAVAQSSCG